MAVDDTPDPDRDPGTPDPRTPDPLGSGGDLWADDPDAQRLAQLREAQRGPAACADGAGRPDHGSDGATPGAATAGEPGSVRRSSWDRRLDAALRHHLHAQGKYVPLALRTAKQRKTHERNKRHQAKLREARRRATGQPLDAPVVPYRLQPKPYTPGRQEFQRSAKGLNRREPAKLRAQAKAMGLVLTDYSESLSMAVRKLEGGRGAFFGFVHLAAEDGDDDCKKIRACYLELPKIDQVRVSLDYLCLASGVSRTQLLKTIVGVAFDYAIDVGNLVAAASHATLVEHTVESAKRIDSAIGLRDRHALLSHAGFLPTPKASVINISATAQAAAQAGAKDPRMPDFLADVTATSAARETVQQQIVIAQDGELVDEGGGPSTI